MIPSVLFVLLSSMATPPEGTYNAEACYRDLCIKRQGITNEFNLHIVRESPYVPTRTPEEVKKTIQGSIDLAGGFNTFMVFINFNEIIYHYSIKKGRHRFQILSGDTIRGRVSPGPGRSPLPIDQCTTWYCRYNRQHNRERLHP